MPIALVLENDIKGSSSGSPIDMGHNMSHVKGWSLFPILKIFLWNSTYISNQFQLWNISFPNDLTLDLNRIFYFLIVLLPAHFDNLELSFGNLEMAINDKTRLSENTKNETWFYEPANIFSWKHHKPDLHIDSLTIFI